jgi:transcriptional regulator with XRE-family HTH domain
MAQGYPSGYAAGKMLGSGRGGRLVSGAQIRAARGLLGWTARDLARRAIVSVATVNLIEEATGLPSTTKTQLEAVQAALEAAGIEFLEGDAPGLRLHMNKTKKKK